jgi:multiple sugar transport system ATP-binding protein
MTVGQNMAFALSLAKVPRAEINEKVTEAARILGLTQNLDRKPANLSGGQRQRVALGRAITRNPKALLMDEPLSNLDANLRVQMRTEVSRLPKRLHTTTVCVTHDQVEAMTLGDRVAVLRGGMLQQFGSPGMLYEHPVNIFVAGFIGSPSMNFLEAELGDGRLQSPLGEINLDDELRRDPENANVDRHVIRGVRPEHFEDAALVSPQERDREGHLYHQHRRHRIARFGCVRPFHSFPRRRHFQRAGRAGGRLGGGRHPGRRPRGRCPAQCRHPDLGGGAGQPVV